MASAGRSARVTIFGQTGVSALRGLGHAFGGGYDIGGGDA